jgi:hypothetical protein
MGGGDDEGQLLAGRAFTSSPRRGKEKSDSAASSKKNGK